MISQNPKSKPSEVEDDSRLAFTMREVAAAIGVSERSVWTMVDTGRLRAIKIGRLVRIPRDALQELLDGE